MLSDFIVYKLFVHLWDTCESKKQSFLCTLLRGGASVLWTPVWMYRGQTRLQRSGCPPPRPCWRERCPTQPYMAHDGTGHAADKNVDI